MKQKIRASLIIATVIYSSGAMAQSSTAIDRINQAIEICRASIIASSSDRPNVWNRASVSGFISSAPDEPRSWTDGSVSVTVAPGFRNGTATCQVKVSGSLRPTAVISAVSTWARAAGFVANQNSKLLFSMETADHYLDAQSISDGMLMEFGWRD